jgi:hypothetical protein
MAAPFAVAKIPTSVVNPKGSTELEPYQISYLSVLLSSSILKFGGPFTLKSGRQSPYFFNAGLFCTGESIAAVASCYAQRIVKSGISFDVLFGPAYKVSILPELPQSFFVLTQCHHLGNPARFDSCYGLTASAQRQRGILLQP